MRRASRRLHIRRPVHRLAIRRAGLAFLVVVAAACRARGVDLGMQDSTYVQILTELRGVADPADLSPALRASRRDAVFRKHGVTAAQLEEASARLAADPERAAALWKRVDEKAAALPPAGAR
ncbi:MAG: DUF4296 domain-containing protein [Gemmatimonadaceae bacterium]|jgi:pyrroline-5-carboxylate reductase|nr:DUF4296 domain-containing protein [Gemmatimonadaceae bacterium]